MSTLKSCILIACIFFQVFIQTNGWVAMQKSEPNTEHDCYTSKLGPMKFGERKRIEGQCATATCGAQGFISLTGCGTVQIAPPCKLLDGDLSKPFPKCCYEIECPEPESNDNLIQKNDLYKAEMEDDDGNDRKDFVNNNKLDD